MELIYQAQGPYPLPEKLPRNIRWARMLLCSYSGRESEMTAVNQYVYHHVMAEGDLPDISESLRHIAIVEMHHLELLAKAISLLGLRPSYAYYQGTRKVRWNAGFVQYGRNLREMLELDIAAEYRAIECYEQAIRCIPEEQLQALLRRIVEDERLHIQVLTGLRDSL